MIALFLAVAASFAFTVGTTPFLIKWLRAQAIGQQIRDDGPVEHPHVNKVGTPTMGGITLVAGACIGYGVAHLRRSDFKFSRSGLLLMGLVLGCMAIGFLDDWLGIRNQRNLGLRKRGKLFGQLAVAFVFAFLSVEWAGASTKLSFTHETGIDLHTWGWIVLAVGMIMATTSINANTADQKPVGAGPFMLTAYSKGASASLRPNPYYWNKDNAYKFGGIDFVKVATGPTAVSSLKAGDVDFVRLESDGYQLIKSDPTYKTAIQPTGAYLQFEFRLKFKDGRQTPFVKPEVRQAFSYGLDRAAINQAAQQGLGDVTTQPFPKGNPAHIDSLDGYYKYDPTKAKQLLAQAGYPNGFSFDMVIPGGGIANMEHQAVEVQQELKKIGVTANIKRIMGNDIATGYYIGQTGDAFVAEELASSFPGGSLNDNYGSGFVANWDGAQRDDITQLMNQAQSQIDVPTAMKYVHQAVDIAVKQALDVPIAFAPQLNSYNSQKVGGTVVAQTNICDAPNLSGLTVKG